jgi:hypothetical protein
MLVQIFFTLGEGESSLGPTVTVFLSMHMDDATCSSILVLWNAVCSLSNVGTLQKHQVRHNSCCHCNGKCSSYLKVGGHIVVHSQVYEVMFSCQTLPGG